MFISLPKKMLLLAFFVILALAVIFTLNVQGYSSGKSGVSQSGCVCHQQGTINIEINGLPSEYEPNTQYNLTIKVDNGEGKGGFDLSATDGIFSNADNNSKLDGEKEVLHSNSNARSWTVQWTSPNSAETTFYIAGLSANGDGSSSGDVWNKAEIKIKIKKPVGTKAIISFPLNNSEFLINEEIVFNSSNSNAVSYEWNFGDGNKNSTNLTEVKHSFANEGIYIVKLKAINGTEEDNATIILNIKSYEISVEKIELPQEHLIEKEEVYIYAVIKNKGNVSAENIVVNFYADSKLIGNIKISIPKDREQIIPMLYKVEKGRHDIKVVVSASGDKNNSDNELTKEINGEEIKIISRSEIIFGILAIFFTIFLIIGAFLYYYRGDRK